VHGSPLDGVHGQSGPMTEKVLTNLALQRIIVLYTL